MKRYICMLRGINLGSHNRIGMPELGAMFEGLGTKNIETYMQSGNVVFSSTEDSKKLSDQIQSAIKKQFNLDVDVIVKSAAEMNQVATSNPFLAGPGVDEAKLHITFLSEVPQPDLLLKISPDLGGEDKWAPVGDVVYLYCPGGYGKTKLSNNLFENKFKVSATTRNWKTVLALAEMSKG